MTPSSEVPTKNLSIGTIAAIIVIAILALGFALYFFQTSAAMTSLNQKISSDNNQISVANTNISALRNNVTSAENQISADKSQMASLQSKIATDNATLSTLKKQNSTDQNLINSLKANITSYNAEFTTLQSQVTNLTGILKLSDFQNETAFVTLHPAVNQMIEVGSTFSTPYAGYVLIMIEGSFNPSDLLVSVANNVSNSVLGNYASYVNSYYPSTVPDSLAIAVVPGQTTVCITANQSGIAPSISVAYYY